MSAFELLHLMHHLYGSGFAVFRMHLTSMLNPLLFDLLPDADYFLCAALSVDYQLDTENLSEMRRLRCPLVGGIRLRTGASFDSALALVSGVSTNGGELPRSQRYCRRLLFGGPGFKGHSQLFPTYFYEEPLSSQHIDSLVDYIRSTVPTLAHAVRDTTIHLNLMFGDGVVGPLDRWPRTCPREEATEEELIKEEDGGDESGSEYTDESEGSTTKKLTFHFINQPSGMPFRVELISNTHYTCIYLVRLVVEDQLLTSPSV